MIDNLLDTQTSVVPKEQRMVGWLVDGWFQPTNAQLHLYRRFGCHLLLPPSSLLLHGRPKDSAVIIFARGAPGRTTVGDFLNQGRISHVGPKDHVPRSVQMIIQ
jgi:hypothetical protein